MDSLNNDIESSVYQTNKKSILFLIIISFFSLIIGFTLNFQVKEQLLGFIESKVKANRKCPMTYRQVSIGTLFTSIEIDGFEISSRCLRTKSSLVIKKIKTSLTLPSLSPLGITLNTQVTDKYSKIDVTTVHGFYNHYIKARSKKLSAKSISTLLNGFNLLGDFEFNTNIDATNKNIKTMDLSLKSKNFSIPRQNVGGFDLPIMKIGQVSLKAKLKNSKDLTISQLILGQEKSPIRANITGKITLNKYNMKKSPIDLKIVIKFSKSFIESFAILNLFLDSSKQDEQGFYHLKIKGTLGSPSKPEYLSP